MDGSRPINCYQQTSVFVLAFSLVDPPSLVEVKERWWPEVNRWSTTTPFILAGLKADLRSDPVRLLLPYLLPMILITIVS